MIYLLTTIWLAHGGSSTVHTCTQTIHRKTQNKRYIKKIGRMRAVPRLGELYPGICLTTEEKARKTLRKKNDSNYDGKCTLRGFQFGI